MHLKLEKLKDWFKSKGKVGVAFSGGVDSALLLKVGKMALGDNVVAVTIHSVLNKEKELEVAKDLAKQLEVQHEIINIDDLKVPEVAHNHKERCYFCKKNRFTIIMDKLKEKNIDVLVEGSNVDDLKDYRPGLRAIKELGIKSPLQEVGFTKKEIRALAKYLDLPVWDKPSEPCLATRFPVGTNLSIDKLKRIEKGEIYLKQKLNIDILRLRDHDGLARIETLDEHVINIFKYKTDIYDELTKLGFKYITIDLMGYKRGSMNSKEESNGGKRS